MIIERQQDNRYFNPADPALGHCTSFFGHRDSLSADKLRRLAATGCRWVEISALQALHVDMFDDERLAELAETLSGLAMRCWSLHAPFCGLAIDDAETRADAVRLLTLSCRRARQLGAAVVVVHPGRDVPGVDADRELRWMREGLAQAAQAADGVTLAVETMSEPAERMLEIIDGLLGVGICFDSGHVNTHAEVRAYLEVIAGRVATVHLHDNDARRDQHLPAGQGVIDWPAMLATLHAGGYDGVLMSEAGDGGRDLPAAVDYFDSFIRDACRSLT